MGTAGHPTKKNAPYLAETVIDFSSQTNAATDVFQAINVPANACVLNAGVDVLTVDSAGNSGTVALGDGTVVYIAATAPTSAVQLANGDAVGEMFVWYDAADTLDVTVATGAINAVIRVWAIIVDGDDPITTQRVTFTAA